MRDIKNIEQLIVEVDGSMAIEGMALKEKDKDRIRRIMDNETSVDKAVHEIINKYLSPQELSYEG